MTIARKIPTGMPGWYAFSSLAKIISIDIRDTFVSLFSFCAADELWYWKHTRCASAFMIIAYFDARRASPLSKAKERGAFYSAPASPRLPWLYALSAIAVVLYCAILWLACWWCRSRAQRASAIFIFEKAAFVFVSGFHLRCHEFRRDRYEEIFAYYIYFLHI